VCGSGWGSFDQWDAAWKSDLIGTKTIGAVGCAMTSVTNALKSRIDKITVGGAEVDVNPGNVNKYLKENNGYVGNLIKWAAIAPAGLTVHMTYKKSVDGPQFAELKGYVEACNAVILNVHNGGHWVLATGAAEGDTFTVKDPGFDTTSYGIADVKRAVIYEFKDDPKGAAAVQSEDAASATPAPATTDAAVTPPQEGTPPEGEATAAVDAAQNGDTQPEEIQLAQADFDLLKAKNGGDFGGDGGPAVAGGGDATAVASNGASGGEAPQAL